MIQNIWLLLIPAIIAFALNSVFTPLILRKSHKNGWFDTVNQRKIHTEDTPRLGGLGIFLSFSIAAASLLFLYPLIPKNSIQLSQLSYIVFFISISLAAIIGLIDDFHTIRPRYKLLVQLIAAVLLVFTGHTFQRLYIPFVDIVFDFHWLSFPLTLIWIIGISNAVNLLDGLDGLAGGVSAIGAFGYSLCMFYLGNAPAGFFSAALFGATLSFLQFNKPPAKIFMGDGGSLFLGLCLASIPLLGINSMDTSHMNLILGASFLLIPIFDTAAAIIRRSIRRQAFYTPDMEHMHHKLLHLGLSNRRILVFTYTLGVLLGLPFIAWTFIRSTWLIHLEMAMWFLAILYFLFLNLYKKKKP